MTAVTVAETGVRRDLAMVLDLVREGTARTIPDLARVSALGRKALTQRVDQLISFGLLEEGQLAPSTGGRAPREITFPADRGRVLVCELDAKSVTVGLTDLAGTVLLHDRELLLADREPLDPMPTAVEVLGAVERLFDGLLAEAASQAARAGGETRPVWGIGLGVLGPVDWSSGRPMAIGMTVPGWADYPVRDRLEARFGVPVWVDNEVNLMALGEFRSGRHRGESNLLYVKLGLGIGAGLVSEGRLHRGTDGTAGELGHIAVTDDQAVVCRCGQVGCLFAVAGGLALAKEGGRAAAAGRSPVLAKLVAAGQRIDVTDVASAAADGDPACMEIVEFAGEQVGRVLGMVVNVYNPGLILVGGVVAAAGDVLLAAVRRAVYRHALPLATRNLRVELSPRSDDIGLVGAAFLVLDHVFSRESLPAWIDRGSPAGLTVADLAPSRPR
ncbi:MAG: ROK family protein [Actinobacteria bacterium]|nr:ROK family protein [Actinomycetota bacterium]